MTKDAKINLFSIMCFRDVADYDYINARLCYRAALISQFLWAASQSIEKLYKGILLFNRIPAKYVSHNIGMAQKLCRDANLVLKISEPSLNLIQHLDKYGQTRYLEKSYFVKDEMLCSLDRAMWELRAYCSSSKDLAVQTPPSSNQLAGGKLEEILAKPQHPARPALVWQNAFFSARKRHTVRVPIHRYMQNSPQFLFPQIPDYVREFVYVPGQNSRRRPDALG